MERDSTPHRAEPRSAALWGALPCASLALNGTIQQASPRLTEVLGHPASALDGTSLHDHLMDPASLPSTLAVLLGSEQVAHVPLALRRADGSVCHLLATLYAPPGPDAAISLVAFDRTAQAVTERENADQLRAVDRTQATIEFDLDGTIRTANDNFLDAMGYTLAEVKGQHHRIFVRPEDAADSEYAAFWARLGSGQTQTGQFERVSKSGRPVFIQASYTAIRDASGEVYKVVKYATDVTAQTIKIRDYEAQIEAIDQSQATIEFDLDGTIRVANRNFLGAMGYTLAEVKGQHHRIFVRPEDAASPEYAAFWKRLGSGQSQTGQFERVGKSGRPVFIQASYTPIRDASGTVYKVVKYASDVTAQTIKIRDYEAQIDAIEQTQATIEFELDGTIRVANRNFLGAMGYTLAEVAGQHHRIFVRPEDSASPEYAAFWKRLGSGQSQTGQFERVGKGGRPVFIQASYTPIRKASGDVYKVVKYATDVTAQTIKIRDYEAQIDAIDKGQATIEFELDGTIRVANDNFLGAMGYTLAEVKGQHHRIFVRPEDGASPEYAAFWTRLASGQTQTGQFERVGKTGRPVFIQASYTPIRDGSGSVYKVVKYATDITAQTLKLQAFESDAREFNQQVLRVAAGAERGDLTVRGDPQSVGPAFRDAVTRINDLLEAVHRPVELTHGCLQDLAVGRPAVVSGARPEGAFGELVDALGALCEVTDEITSVSQQIAEGQLDVKFQPRGPDDALLAALERMVDNLTVFLRHVKVTTTELNLGSDQVQEASHSLAETSSRSAAALQQVSATMEIISQQTQENTKSTDAALELARDTRVDAREGDAQMTAMVASMQDISEASRNISRIIKVIDDIAFQTNLLALNAAVEAGRAGEHGRGFAVVAEEVRRLAARSAEAAQQTTELIEGSAKGVEHGLSVAESSAAMLSGIVGRVDNMSDLLGEIAASTSEQAHGIEEVHVAIRQLDDGTQVNTAKAEELAAAASDVSRSSSALEHHLGQFKVPPAPQTTANMSPDMLRALQTMLDG